MVTSPQPVPPKRKLVLGDADEPLAEPRPQVVQIFRRIVRDRGGRFGLIIVGLMAVAALFAPILAPYDPLEIGIAPPFASPTLDHLFGTDNLGRDLLSRLIFGARLSFRVSFFAALVALLMATPLGLIAGYAGGFVDSLITRFFDTIFAFPAVLIGVALAAILGGSIASVIVAVGIISIPTLGRLVRVAVMAQTAEDYVLAARALGASTSRIIWQHILRNVFPSLLVQLTLIMSSAVLLEAEFSFLGLGSKPPAPSWGIMLNEGRQFLSQSPWLGIFAGLAITLLILGFNGLSDALQKALNPRQINR